VRDKLQQLIETGQLDWDNERHREAYLKMWVKGEIKTRGVSEEEDGQSRPAYHRAIQGAAQ
jgi:hypothetical protein